MRQAIALSNVPGMDLIIATAQRCREWPVLAFARIGHCGYCGQVPVVTDQDVSVESSS